MVVGDKKFGVVSYVMSYFPTPRTVFCAFPETGFPETLDWLIVCSVKYLHAMFIKISQLDH